MKELRNSIIRIQTNLDIFAKKSAKNTMGKGFNYFTETDLYNALKPLMKQENIGYTIETTGTPIITQIGSMYQYLSQGQLTLFKDNDEIKLGITLSAINTDPAKAIGSALTYGTRYWLCKEFGIATDELDPDTTENTKAISEVKEIKQENNIDILKSELIKQIQEKLKNNKEYKEQTKLKIINWFQEYYNNTLLLPSLSSLTIEQLKELL